MLGLRGLRPVGSRVHQVPSVPLNVGTSETPELENLRTDQLALTRIVHVATSTIARIMTAGVQRTAIKGDRRPRRRNPLISAAARLVHSERARTFTATLLPKRSTTVCSRKGRSALKHGLVRATSTNP